MRLQKQEQYEIASLDSIADVALRMVDTVLKHPDFPLEQALGTVLARLPRVEDTDRWTEIVAMRQQQWLLMNWLAGVNESVPRGIAEEAIAWVSRQIGRKAAKSCKVHAWVLGRAEGTVDTTVQDWNRVDRVTAWMRLLAAVTAVHTLAWLVGREFPDWAPMAWPVDPRALPEIRRKQMRFVGHPESRQETARFFADGALSLGPAPRGNSSAGNLLAEREVQRLSKARLYFVDADMCNVARRKGARPRATPLASHRVPSTNGMIFFAEPVPLRHCPDGIVAASWGPFDPGSHPDGWLQMSDETFEYHRLKLGEGPHWWVTLYYIQDDVIDGERDTPPLDTNNTCILSAGQVFEQPTDDLTTQSVARVLIACWDLITQEQIGKPITDTTLLQRKPAKTRADRRRGIEDDGAVRLVTVRGRPQVPPHGPDALATVPHQRSSIQYKHRWTVQEHSRSHCRNPRGHADGDCTHEDITILEFVKGPADAPFLRRDIVHILRKLDAPGSSTGKPRA